LTTVVTNTIGRNPNTGVINYSYEYDDGPPNCIAGALSETFTITDINPSDVFAVIPVMGRTKGPVLQDMATKTERKRQINYEATIAPADDCPTTVAGVIAMMSKSPSSDVDTIIDAIEADLVATYDQVFKSNDQETWGPKDGRYSRNVEFTIGEC